jgi:hypothetical protein
MAISLIEYAKSYDVASKQRAIIELFPDSVDFMGIMPFSQAPGGAFRWDEEGALPANMAFRAINETPSSDHGLITDRVEMCFPLSGNLDVDRVLVSRHGPERRSMNERMAVKRKAKVWADTFMEGDNVASPREWSGLKTRLKAVGGSTDGSNYRSRILANSASSGGAALSLAQLDRAIGLVNEPNAIILPKALKDRFPAAVRDSGVGGLYTNDPTDMGHRVEMYRDIPLYCGYGVSNFGEFLPFDETAVGGGSAVTSSLYVLRFAEDGVCGIETRPMEVTDMGLLEDGVNMRTNVEWDHGMTIRDPFSAIRLSSITNAAIVK